MVDEKKQTKNKQKINKHQPCFSRVISIYITSHSPHSSAAISSPSTFSTHIPSSWEVMNLDRELLKLIDTAVELMEERD